LKNNDVRLCSGFGRSEEDAANNAAKIALEAVIDSQSPPKIEMLNNILKQIPINKVPPVNDSLYDLLKKLRLEDFYEKLKSDKMSIDALKSLNRKDLQNLGLPIGPAVRLWASLHPSVEPENSKEREIQTLKEENLVVHI
jgi:hypothetical protein